MKKIKSIIFILLATMALFCGCFTGCFDITYSFIEDGDFKYYYIKDEDCYAIVGTTEQGFKQTVYVPTHFRGKEVRYTSFIKTNYSGAKEYSLKVKNCDRLYFSYLHKARTYSGDVKTVFFSNASEDYCNEAWNITCLTDSGFGYVSVETYEYFKKDILKYSQELLYSEINGYINVRINSGNRLIKANTSYLFNYVGAPNEGYFFVNDFERGGLIENTPYEPIRTGYDFAGWYKEPECLNKWNFEVDRLPEAKYDENGYVIEFVETKLYAKWEKI